MEILLKDYPIVIDPKENESINRSIDVFISKKDHKGVCDQEDEYVGRGAPRSKVWIDKFRGKKGEFFVAHAFHRLGLPFVDPDLEIYDRQKKNWNADLPYRKEGCNFDTHVKTAATWSSGILSWTFQYSNGGNRPGGRDRLFDDPDCKDLIAFVQLEDIMSNSAIIKAVVPWRDVLPQLKLPIMEKFKKTKRCFYSSSLI